MPPVRLASVQELSALALQLVLTIEYQISRANRQGTSRSLLSRHRNVTVSLESIGASANEFA